MDSMMSVSDLEIEGLDEDAAGQCDENDVLCKATPAIAETIRAIAREIRACRPISDSRFAEGVVYKDPTRSFQGRTGYKRLTFVQDNVSAPKAKLQRMRMEDQKTCCIDWCLRGRIGGQDVSLGLME